MKVRTATNGWGERIRREDFLIWNDRLGDVGRFHCGVMQGTNEQLVELFHLFTFLCLGRFRHIFLPNSNHFVDRLRRDPFVANGLRSRFEERGDAPNESRAFLRIVLRNFVHQFDDDQWNDVAERIPLMDHTLKVIQRAFLFDVNEHEQRLASTRHVLFDIEEFADQFRRVGNERIELLLNGENGPKRIATPVGVTRDSRQARIDGINDSTYSASFSLQRNR